MTLDEHITKAFHSTEFLVGDLRDALGKASPLEELVLRSILAEAYKLHLRIEQFAQAINTD